MNRPMLPAEMPLRPRVKARIASPVCRVLLLSALLAAPALRAGTKPAASPKIRWLPVRVRGERRFSSGFRPTRPACGPRTDMPIPGCGATAFSRPRPGRSAPASRSATTTATAGPTSSSSARSDGCRLFRNLGDWKFEDVTDRAGVGDTGDAALIWKQGATFVDVNNDGLLDIYVCRFDAPNLLYINQGDGTFKEMAHAYGLDVTDASGMAAFCDYDRDGWLDVFIQTNLLSIAQHPNGQRNYLFHNNRDGTFTNVTDRGGHQRRGAGTFRDLVGLRRATAGPTSTSRTTSASPTSSTTTTGTAHSPTSSASVVPHTTFSSMGSDLGDVNNDGQMDFLVADMAATTHEKDQRTASTVRGGVLGHLDPNMTVPKYLHNALYLNTGTGRCREAAYLAGVAASDWTWSVRLEDLDNDGRLDLFVTNGMNREQTNIDLISREMQAETHGRADSDHARQPAS